MSRKLALIIINNDYSHRPLKNDVNDSTSLVNVLRYMEYYQVELKINLNPEDMYKYIKKFAKSIKYNSFIIFFFDGHSIQWYDHNFLLPCNTNKITRRQRFAINAQSTVDEIASMNSHIISLLLDCCRMYWMSILSNDRNPGQEVGGLKQITAPRQTDDANGALFIKYLIEHITTPWLNLERIMTADIIPTTGSLQIPFRVNAPTSEEIHHGKSMYKIVLKTDNVIRPSPIMTNNQEQLSSLNSHTHLRDISCSLTFEELKLDSQLLKGIYNMGFRRPSRIQECVLPQLLGDPPRNIIAQSPSGTGKTVNKI
jgi:hypothetical protein